MDMADKIELCQREAAVVEVELPGNVTEELWIT